MPENPTAEKVSEPVPDAPAIAVGDPADYVVLFLDFMGQKDHLRRWRDLTEWGYHCGQNHWQSGDPHGLAEAVRKSAGVIAMLYRATRDHLLGSLVYDRFGTPPDFQLTGIQFSDTVVFYGKMEAKEQVGPQGLFRIFSALIAASSVTFNSLLLDTPVRGAITIGQAVEGITGAVSCRDADGAAKKSETTVSDSFFYGPVLERAHALENRVADYTRILVDWSVVDYLNRLQLVSPNWPEFDGNYRDILGKSLGLVPGGVDGDESPGLGGFRVLDWAGKNFFDGATPDQRKWFADKLPVFLRFAKEAQANAMQLYSKTGDQEQLRVAGKHARLAHYIETRLPIWAGCQASGDH